MGLKVRFALPCGLLSVLTACSSQGFDAGPLSNGVVMKGGSLGFFLLGMWHGVTTPFTGIMWALHHLWPIFFPWIWTIYVSHQPTVFYNIGFLFGASLAMVVIIAVIRRLWV